VTSDVKEDATDRARSTVVMPNVLPAAQVPIAMNAMHVRNCES